MRRKSDSVDAVSESDRPIETAVAAHPFLAGLKPEHLRLLSQNAMHVKYQPGETIFREGDPANRFYLIESGSVLLESQPHGADPIPVQTIGPGNVLGWSWLFPPYVWHFSARALQPTTAIFLFGTRLRQDCEENPAFGYELMSRIAGVVIDRLQETRRMYLAAR
jgi:CRP/FNR family transcriptional regulator, cyclic AMP receptor protein